MNKTSAKFQVGIREKVLIAATLIILVILSIKSIQFDAYTPKATDDMTSAEHYIETEYDGGLYESGFIKIRIINYSLSEEGEKLHLRKYLLGIVPIGDSYTFVK